MKRFSLFCTIALFATFLSSCSNTSNPTAQIDEPSITAPATNVTIIPLPEAAAATSLEKSYYFGTGTITPKDGGDITGAKLGYSSKLGGLVLFTMTLHFPAGAVDKNTQISINLDTQTLTADFTPNGLKFKKSATLEASVSGLASTSIPLGAKVGLYYLNGGSYELMPGYVSVSRFANFISLDLSDGQISHFSLYGFGFTK